MIWRKNLSFRNVLKLEQSKASYLEECENKCFHKIDAEINVEKRILFHIKQLCFCSLPFFLMRDFLLCVVTLVFS